MLETPAILGGQPVRPQGTPTWPLANPQVDRMLMELMQNRAWGVYHGPYVSELERSLQSCLNVEHVILCASGTAAVELALRGCNLQPTQLVGLSAYDFKANFTNVLMVGATPCLFDVAPDQLLLDLDRVEKSAPPMMQALLVSHLHGALLDMPRLKAWCSSQQIALIEDACQVTGGCIQHQPCGTWGDVGVWSFGGSKLLTSGRGGVVFTNNARIAQRIRLYQNRGNEAYPLSEMQAAILLPQVVDLPQQHEQRGKHAQELMQDLISYPGLQCLSDPFDIATSTQPAYYKLAFQYHPTQWNQLSRAQWIEAMRAEGIGFDAGFRGLHLIHSRARYEAATTLEHATARDQDLVVLHHPILCGTADERGQIRTALDKIRHFSLELLQFVPRTNGST
jgi:dTDP-4-amino-4,6-dideoxygalactose transaminase